MPYGLTGVLCRLAPKLVIALYCLGSAVGAGALGAQSSRQTVPAEAIDAVIRYRRAWLADSTRFDACSVSEWVDRAARGVANPDQVLLGRAGNGCVRGRVSPTAVAASSVVLVDSAAVSGSAASIVVIVRHGEYTHYETFSLVRHRAGTIWGVRTVSLWGAVQSSPPRRRPSR